MVRLLLTSVRRSRGAKGGVFEVLRRSKSWEMGEMVGEAEESDEITRASHPFDHQVGGIRVHVASPDCFALPRRQKRSSGAPIFTQKPPRNLQKKYIHAMDQTIVLCAFASFLVLLISSVSFSRSKSRFGPLVMHTRSSLFFEP